MSTFSLSVILWRTAVSTVCWWAQLYLTLTQASILLCNHCRRCLELSCVTKRQGCARVGGVTLFLLTHSEYHFIAPFFTCPIRKKLSLPFAAA